MWLRACGARLAGRDKHGTGWPVVLGRAIQRTNNYFIVLLTILVAMNSVAIFLRNRYEQKW